MKMIEILVNVVKLFLGNFQSIAYLIIIIKFQIVCGHLNVLDPQLGIFYFIKNVVMMYP